MMTNLGGGRELILVEDGEQLRVLVGPHGARRDDVAVVALTPAAVYATERAGIPCVPIDAFYSERTLLQLGDDNLSRVEAFCDCVDERLSRHRSDFACLSEFSAHDLFYWVRTLFDSVLSRWMALEAALQHVQPRRIIYCRPGSDPVRDDLYFRDLSLTPALASLLAGRFGLDVRELDPPHALSSGRDVVPRWRGSPFWARDGLSYLRWRAARAGWAAASGVTLIPLHEGYDLRPLVREWDRRQLARVPFRVVRWALERPPAEDVEARVARAAQQLLDGMLRDERFLAIFVFGGVQAFPVFRSRVEHLFLGVLPRLVVMTERARALLRQVPEAIVVCTPAVELLQLAVLAATRSLGTPAAVYQHGGGYGVLHLPMIERHDLALADDFLAYGPGVADFYSPADPSGARPSARRRARLLPVGSAALDDLCRRPPPPARRTQAGERRTVVYVVTNFSGDLRYFDYRTYPDLTYWRLQQEVVLRCGRRRDVRLLVKLHPSERRRHPVFDLIRDHGLANCRVLVETPFTELLDRADLFVIDYPSSTALLQALTTDRKILAFADREFTRPNPRAIELLRRRVVLATSRDEFLRQLDAMLDEPDWTVPRPSNDDFLRAYGTGPDGDSAERAITALLGIQTNRRPQRAGLRLQEVTTV